MRTQYDVLRRLRSYWLPRFIIHSSSMPKFKHSLDTGTWEDVDTAGLDVKSPSQAMSTITYLPLVTISCCRCSDVASLGADDANATHFSFQTLESIAMQSNETKRPNTSQLRLMSARSASAHHLTSAMATEPVAGFPFRGYIRNFEKESALHIYDFLMTLDYISDWTTAPPTSNDQTRKQHAVMLSAPEAFTLFNVFLNRESPFYVRPPQKLISNLKTLERVLKAANAAKSDSSRTVRLSSFRQIKQYAVGVLSDCLQNYRDHEVSTYYEAREGKPFDTPSRRLSTTPSKTTSRKDDDSSPSETTTGVSRPWLGSEDDSTETDSASTMYSYDVERLRQLASVIRRKGAKKPQHTPKKVTPPKKAVRARTTTSSAAAGDNQAPKVQFILPGEEDVDEITDEDQRDDRSEDSEEAKRRRKKKKDKLKQHPNRMGFLEVKSNKLLYAFLKKYISNCEGVETQNVFQMYQLCDVLLAIPPNQSERMNALHSELVRTFLHANGPKQIAMPNDRYERLTREYPHPSEEAITDVRDYVLPALDQAAANFSLGFATLLKEYKLDIRGDLGQHMTKAEIALRSLTLKPSSKRRRALGKHSARQAPTSEHKVMFLHALQRSKEGNLPLDLLHFYKYLQGFGVQEGYPLIHNDLLFYVEVIKFSASYHQDFDLVTLKRKIISILDCYIDSAMQPTLQIDIKTGTAERLRRAADSFVNDKGRDAHLPTLFDDAQHTVFNELLPFWAGFVTAMSPSEREGKRPVLKNERMQKKRLETFLKSKEPETEFSMPDIKPKFDMRGIEFTFSVNSGIQWKAWSEASSSRSSTPQFTGRIEVVKAPPTSQKRIVRRSGFKIRKIQATGNAGAKDGGPPRRTTFADDIMNRDSKSKPSGASRASGSDTTSVRNYTTSVC